MSSLLPSLGKLGRKEPKTPSPLQMDSLLLVRLSSMGDVVCTLPVAGFLKQALPEVQISWVVDPRFASLVEDCRHVDEVITVKATPLRQSWEAVHKDYSAVLDLQGLVKSAWMTIAAKSKIKLGYHWQREGACLTSAQVLPDPTSIHIVDQYVDVARALVAKSNRPVPEFVADFGLVPNSEATKEVQQKLLNSGVKGRFVVMNPGGAWATKQWKPQSFAQVGAGLLKHGIQSVLIGSKSRAETTAIQLALAEAQKLGSPLVSMQGQTTIRELTSLIGLSAAHLGGDTGSTHIAAALSIPCVGLYSITKPERSCPYGQIDNCLYNPMKLEDITAEEVLGKLLPLLQ